MGRLIDIDILFDYFGNDAIDKTTRSNIEYFVSENGTVQAIPKSDYENRLKADMVAMLKELEVELYEKQYNYNNRWVVNHRDISKLINEKINALKENKDGN